MTVGEFIQQLQKLPADFEIAVLTQGAIARPPSIQRVVASAWNVTAGSGRAGLDCPARAFLVRPAREIIGGKES